jgi:hypothetical protein
MTATYTGAAPPGATTSAYPIDVQIDYPTNPGRFYAIPLIGFLARVLLLIPHIIALYILGLVVAVCQLFTWVPVLFTGTYPRGLYDLASDVIRWYHMIPAYGYGLTDIYPPFGLSNKAGFPVQITYDYPGQSVRFWAIPLLGWIAKEVILIPHFIVLYVLGVVAGLMALVAWIPVLFGGTYPRWAYDFITGYIRWSTRVFSFLLGLTDKYPPFVLGN